MTRRKPNPPHAPPELRQQGERRSNLSREDISAMTPEDIQKLVYELQVHQVELEMQNENLRQAEQELAKARDRYMDLYQSAPVGYLTLDERQTILQANQAAAAMFQVEAASLPGMRLGKFVAAEDADACYLHLRGAADGSGPQRGEFRFRRPDGSTFWAAVDTVFTSAAQDGAQCRITLRDVTERKNAEKALRDGREELDRRNREWTAELSRMVASLQDEVAHRAQAEEVLRERSEQLRRLATQLTMAEQRERRHLSELLHDNIQQLLVAAKFRLAVLDRTGDKAARQAAADAGDMIDESIEASRSLAIQLSPPILLQGALVPALEWLTRWMFDKHGLVVELTVQDRIETLAEDMAILLFQVTRELLFNVIKHAGVKAARIQVTRLNEGLRITVADEGSGFAPTVLDGPAGQSQGLGLFGIRERLGWFGGSFEIDSAPGRGSRFTLTVPLPKLETGKPAADGRPKVSVVIAPNHTGTEGRIRVVLVDDHIVVRQGLATLLRAEPDMAIVGEASDGESAVKLIREIRPDVALMDISMPFMNGIEATRIIHAEMPDVRVIALSMFDESERADAMRDAGAAAYLIKSGPYETLIATIRACKSQSSAPPPTIL